MRRAFGSVRNCILSVIFLASIHSGSRCVWTGDLGFFPFSCLVQVLGLGLVPTSLVVVPCSRYIIRVFVASPVVVSVVSIIVPTVCAYPHELPLGAF